MDVWKRWIHNASIQIGIIKSGKKGKTSGQAGIIQSICQNVKQPFLLDALITNI